MEEEERIRADKRLHIQTEADEQGFPEDGQRAETMGGPDEGEEKNKRSIHRVEEGGNIEADRQGMQL